MNIRPLCPPDQATRKQAIRAALITENCIAKILRHQEMNDHKRAKAVEDGVVGYLRSRDIIAEHLIWARIELRCHIDGGQA